MSKWAASFLALLACNSAGAALVSIDFSGPSPGDIVTNQFPGVHISLLGGAPIAGPRIYVLEDTSGNPVDVLGASGNAITPGDNVGSVNPPFFDIRFQFTGTIDYFSLLVLDAEEAVSATGYLGSNAVQTVVQGSLVGTHVGPVFNGPVYLLELGAVGGSMRFNRVVVDLTEDGGPELFDNLQFSTRRAAPEPGSLLLVTAALVLGLLITRRKRPALPL
jgi:hypothetical protein